MNSDVEPSFVKAACWMDGSASTATARELPWLGGVSKPVNPPEPFANLVPTREHQGHHFQFVDSKRVKSPPPRSVRATMDAMSRYITQRELRNESGRIMRALDRGKSFIVTRNGVPVGELIPLRQRVFVPADAAVAAFAGAPRVAPGRFRKDVDAVIDQDPTPRG